MYEAVFLLFHLRSEDDEREEDWKIVGVYNSEQAALLAAERARKLPGFCNHPDGFHIDKYDMNKDNWTSGFVVGGDDLVAQTIK